MTMRHLAQISFIIISFAILTSCTRDNVDFIYKSSGLDKCILNNARNMKGENQIINIKIVLDKKCDKIFTDPIEDTEDKNCKKLLIEKSGCWYDNEKTKRDIYIYKISERTYIIQMLI